ncbi:DUF4153 domain-containing protein [Plantactinospora endophytica]|uniref:DUF4173 domain-containing protein n=1 Tax=Plantactinospora endophytica TaxID=673535 RepID=A0ABQ4E2L9_9ACTN|nr:DUF4173 domain-containing protein [Plantactinospora endophytica]GIG88956.1 hypothetical protein Pen02_38920 [Plantactinospora endophytica]
MVWAPAAPVAGWGMAPGPVAVPAPSWIATRWPGPIGGPTRPVLVGVAAAATVAAVSIPLTRAGIGWLIAGLAGTAALVTAAWPTAHPADTRPTDTPGNTRPTDTPGNIHSAGAPGGTRPPSTGSGTRPVGTGSGTRPASGPAEGWRRVGWVRPLWAAATVALLGVGTIRAAGWLFVLCLLTAALTATLTITDGRSVRALLFSALVPPAAVIEAMPWLAKGLTRSAGSGRGPAVARTLVSVVVSLGLLVVFGLLFSSADAAFAGLLDQILPELSVRTMFRWVFLFVTVGAALLGAAYVLAAPPDLTGMAADPSRRRLHRAEWMLPVVLLDALFAGFVAVQVTTLFGGSEHVLRTAGLTYAEYARRGFWQLLAVSLLTLLVIGAAARWAPRKSRTDRALIRILLGALTLLSLVVVASALFRMDVYADAYGATRLRLLVAVCEAWLGLVFVLIALAGVRLAARWLPGLAIGTAVLALLTLALANPDRLIAEHNVDRYRQSGQIDIAYLSGLSADAVPALDRLPDSLRDCALWSLAAGSRPDDWRETNLARIEARRILAERPATSRRFCPT